MDEIGRALLQMRLDSSALRGIGPDGANVSWILDTEFDANEVSLPRAVLSVRTFGSDTTALVPFALDETIEVSPNGTGTALQIAARIVSALRGRAWYGPDSSVQQHVLAGIDSDSAAGAKSTVTLRWEGRASWRPR